VVVKRVPVDWHDRGESSGMSSSQLAGVINRLKRTIFLFGQGCIEYHEIQISFVHCSYCAQRLLPTAANIRIVYAGMLYYILRFAVSAKNNPLI